MDSGPDRRLRDRFRLSRRAVLEGAAGGSLLAGAATTLGSLDLAGNTALAAVSLHTLAMLLVMGLIATLVYRWIGVGMLRRAWVNLDLVWTGVLALAGGITLALGLWP